MIDEDGDLYVSQNNTHTMWFKASSRNLLNIGTISSGDITATRLVSDAGNNYSQIKLSGDNGANGNSYRFSLNNNNTLLLQKLDNFAANSTVDALTIDSSQNATFTGDVSLPDSKKLEIWCFK